VTTVRALLIDDEPPARRKLRTLLAAWRTIEIIGEAGDGLEAIGMIESLNPDLVFLDIRMPELDGFGVLDALDPDRLPVVVFVTAHDEFAIRAFEAGAVDYVLKPVDRARLNTAVSRAVERVTLRQGAGPGLRKAIDNARTAAPVERFVIRSLDRLRIVAADDVRWIESAGNYVKLHTTNGVHLVRGTLQELERRLDPTRFARIHRTTIVALAAVRQFIPAGRGDYHAQLHSGERLTLSRRFRDRLPAPLFGH
jgi:two-component system LytT family response regulator